MKALWSTFSTSFSPLKDRNFRIFEGGQAISLIGTWLQTTAQSWLVWQITGSTSALGLLMLAGTLPILLIGPWAGVWADRWDRRKLLIGTQIGAMLLAFMLAVLVQTGLVQLWHVIALSALLGVVNALDYPAQQAFVGDLSGVGEIRKAVTINNMLVQLSRMVGPAIAGVLIATIGNAPAFWINGLSFAAVIASLIAVRTSQVRRAPSTAKPTAQILEAVRFVRTQPRLQDLFLLMAIMILFIFATMSLLPAVATQMLHSDATMLGALQGASGAGSLLGLLVIAPFAQASKRSGVNILIEALNTGLWLVVLGVSHTPALSLFAIFMGSVSGPLLMTTVIGLAQVMVPDEMRARILSFITMLMFGVQPLSALGVAALAQRLSVDSIVQFNGAMIIILTLGLWAVRSDLRRWNFVLPQADPRRSEASA